jgi:succinate dehydrogenase / fumarate reductase, cytochrome b subunit
VWLVSFVVGPGSAIPSEFARNPKSPVGNLAAVSFSLTRESFFWHRVHSLTGIVPVGTYMVQHLTLNSFSLAGPEKFNSVIAFFAGMPAHLLTFLEWVFIYLPLAFHGVYGIFISGRAQPNYFGRRYNWSENRMYTFQRWSGVALFFLLIAHIVTTTVNAKVSPSGHEVIEFDAWTAMLSSGGTYLGLILYAAGVVLAAYHLAYGWWNFCIRWGITVSERSQEGMQKFSAWLFVGLTLLGWGALAGFLLPHKGGMV